MKIRKVAGFVCYKYNKYFRRRRLFVINITNVLDVGVYPKYKRPNRRAFVINITKILEDDVCLL